LASIYKVTSVLYCNQGIVKGEVSLYYTVDLLFDWFGLVCFAKKQKFVSCHAADSKPVKQEVNGTVILPPLVFPAVIVALITGVKKFIVMVAL
jgi:hypothetical protein